MRLWVDGEGRMLTDEQVLRQIAVFGSLSAACERGEIRLLSNEVDAAAKASNGKKKTRLSDYLEAG